DSRCHRSSRSYSTLVTQPGMSGSFYTLASGSVDPGTERGENKYGSDLNVRSSNNVSWVDLACSGAITDNVLPVSQGGVLQQGNSGEDIQCPCVGCRISTSIAGHLPGAVLHQLGNVYR